MKKQAIFSLFASVLLLGSSGALTVSAAESDTASIVTESGTVGGSESANLQNQWAADDNGNRSYYGADGQKVTGWQTIDGSQYYFDSDGVMATGWQEIGGNRYYFGKSGVMRTGWRTIDGKRYYFGENGTLYTGTWKTINGKKYGFDETYAMVTGLQNINGKTYYFNSKGVLQTNLKKTIDGKTYYFGKTGAMVVNAFCTVNDKKLYFGKDGALCVSTWKTVDGKKYYLTKNGTPATGWKTISGKKYYFRKSGVMVTGAVKIGKSYYYFNEKGQLQTTTKTVGKTTYYIDDNGCIEARKKGTTYYYADGSKMSSVDALDFETLQTAKGIVAEITTSSMTQSQKIKACFDWVIKKPYVTRRSFVNEPGWPAVYANDHFLLGGGNCFADAAAFAYLAKALGCKNIYVCVDADEPGVGHSWAEVDGKVYDPLFAEAKDYNAYFGVAISKYPLYAILHIAV